MCISRFHTLDEGHQNSTRLLATNPSLATQAKESTMINQWNGVGDCPTLTDAPMTATAPIPASKVDGNGTTTHKPMDKALQRPQ